MASTPPRPRVHVIALGGTIASTASGADTGVTPGISGDDLVRAVPAITEYADITTEQLAQVGSASLTVGKIVVVAEAARSAIDDGAVGVVVTQGTDSLEETAFVLAMLHDRPEPVIVTGAMRNPTLPGADGPANLLAAVQVACSEQSRDLGAVVVFNDEIHDPVFVRKSHTSSPATFTSGPAAGPIGWVSEGDVVLPHRPVRRTPLPMPSGEIAPVALLPATLGDDMRLLDFLRECGYVAVVIDGMGGGHVPETAVDAIARIAAQMPVVMASRTGAGRTLRRTYSYPGSEIALAGLGVLSAGVLDGRKARLALSLLLSVASSAPIDQRWRTFIDEI
ncbi:L-asparaginase [Antricoccus suffuscus]|uniref:L-asparaginase n=1 Tax=Antricoccus suffuscus TaxID=1629062 RepID=A0A2T0ZB37_9ACTN|nr:asparaginase [Antricoccus suffuscus]PRZ33562.1 L-asparaginase [Antricoccus suffuscus]